VPQCPIAGDANETYDEFLQVEIKDKLCKIGFMPGMLTCFSSRFRTQIQVELVARPSVLKKKQ